MLRTRREEIKRPLSESGVDFLSKVVQNGDFSTKMPQNSNLFTPKCIQNTPKDLPRSLQEALRRPLGKGAEKRVISRPPGTVKVRLPCKRELDLTASRPPEEGPRDLAAVRRRLDGALVKPHFDSLNQTPSCTGAAFSKPAETHPSGRYD